VSKSDRCPVGMLHSLSNCNTSLLYSKHKFTPPLCSDHLHPLCPTIAHLHSLVNLNAVLCSAPTSYTLHLHCLVHLNPLHHSALTTYILISDYHTSPLSTKYICAPPHCSDHLHPLCLTVTDLHSLLQLAAPSCSDNNRSPLPGAHWFSSLVCSNHSVCLIIVHF
jgi:hypothetical protein